MTLVARPANEVSWDDVREVFGERGEAARCQCQWYKLIGDGNWTMPREEKAHRFREQLDCGYPDAEHTAGLVGYLDGEPIAWVAIEPRAEYARLLGMPIPWRGRDEDKQDPHVWAVTCFVIKVGHRRQGHSATMLDHVGARSVFAAAGFREITHPTKRRYVMRLDF